MMHLGRKKGKKYLKDSYSKWKHRSPTSKSKSEVKKKRKREKE